MAINKIVFDAKVLIDLTEDTVTADTLVEGVTAHDKSGAKIVGTYTPQTSQDLINFIEGNLSGDYTIPDGTSKIATAAFEGYSDLTLVSFPSSLKTINSLAFANISDCLFDFSKCTEIPNLLSSDAFTLSDTIWIKVPENLYNEWIVAPQWSDLASRIGTTNGKLSAPIIRLDDGTLAAPVIYLEEVDV